jgi:hypothetical protein
MPGPAAADAGPTQPAAPPAPETVLPPKPPSEEPAALPDELPAAFGRYRLLKLLGKGGMGAVYLAHDTQLDRPVALKVPFFSRADGPPILARFYREARSAATVLHPNVCPVYDVGEVGGVPYLTMAFIEGKSLADFARTRPLTPRQSAMLVRKLALALQEAHKRGVVHRDLKPANVMIDRRGEPMVMDFGLARRARRGDPRLTQMGDVMGTPAYMPPEQVSGNVDAMGPPCDVYSLGVILYELLSGRLPFTGDSMAMLSQVLLDQPPPPSKFRPDLDPELEAICLKAMAKKAADRYGSMAELAAALIDHLRGKVEPAPETQIEVEVVRVSPRAAAPPAEAPAPTAPERKPRRPRRRKARRRKVWPWLGVAAALAAGVGALAVLGWVLYQRTNYGTVRVVVSNPDLPVELSIDGEAGHYPGDTLRLRPGPNHVVIAAGPGIDTTRKEFTVRRGAYDDVVVEVRSKSSGAPKPAGTGAGLLAEVYQGPNFEHKVKVRIDAQVNGHWNLWPDKDVPRGPFSIRWTGSLKVSEPGRYKITAFVDDGAKVWIDGRLLIDEWHHAPGTRYTADADLTAGLHPLRIEYYETYVGKAEIVLSWQRQGGSGERVVPAEALVYDRAAYERAVERLPEVEKHFFTTEPKNVHGYLLRAYAFYVKKDYDHSQADFQEWARLTARTPKPANDFAANYYNDLAWGLATGHDTPPAFGATAVALAEKACRMTDEKNASMLDTLAAAYARAGRFEDAVRRQQTAVGLLGAGADKADYTRRLQLYQMRKPYLLPAPK